MSSDVTINALARADLPAIGRLFAERTGRAADLDLLGSWIDAAPGVGAHHAGELVGYVVAAPFAPDIVELASVQVAPSRRDAGIGSALVRAAEDRWVDRGGRAAVAVSSTAYETLGPPRSSRGFWERAGYRAVLETPETVVMARQLTAGSTR